MDKYFNFRGDIVLQFIPLNKIIFKPLILWLNHDY